MSVREYIGARYVPYFDGTWDSSKNYEPLTVVESNGNSYTSRQYVPAGTLLTNNQYWAQTGNYNAQVEQYRAEVRTYSDRLDQNSEAIANETAARIAADTSMQTTINGFDTRILANADAITAETSARTSADSTLTQSIADETTARETAINSLTSEVETLEGNVYTKAESDARYMPRTASGDDVLVCFGDSILAGWSEETPNGIPAWDSYLGNALGYESTNIFKRAVGGAGFASGTQFSAMVSGMVSDLQNAGKSADDVRLVVVGGGVNDARNNVGHTPMQNGVRSFVNAAAAAFPNAIIHLFVGLIGNRGAGALLFDLIEDARVAALEATAGYLKRVVFHSGVWTWNYDGNDSGVSADRIHLLAGGQKRAGTSMAIEINGGDAENHECWFPVTDINGNTLVGGARNGDMISFTLATNVTSTGANNLALGVDVRYGFESGCIAFSNENQNGNRIFFYSMNDATWNAYQALSNAGCYGMATYRINSTF